MWAWKHPHLGLNDYEDTRGIGYLSDFFFKCEWQPLSCTAACAGYQYGWGSWGSRWELPDYQITRFMESLQSGTACLPRGAVVPRVMIGGCSLFRSFSNSAKINIGRHEQPLHQPRTAHREARESIWLALFCLWLTQGTCGCSPRDTGRHLDPWRPPGENISRNTQEQKWRRGENVAYSSPQVKIHSKIQP